MYIIIESEEQKQNRIDWENKTKRRCKIGRVSYKWQVSRAPVSWWQNNPANIHYQPAWWQNPVVSTC